MIRTVPDFPRPGVQFRDISPLLADPERWEATVEQLSDRVNALEPEVLLALESRGFLLGAALARSLNLPLVMARKPGKLPPPVLSQTYQLEYGSDELQIRSDVLSRAQRVVVVDDFLVTGGTVGAAIDLAERSGARVVGICVLEALNEQGREALRARGFPCVTLDSPALAPLVRSSSSGVPTCHQEIVLLCHPEMATLARRIERSAMGWLLEEPVSWKRFPDGYPNVHFPSDLVGERVVFLGSLFRHEKFLEQLELISILGRQDVQSLDLFLPYFGPGTMERVETEGTLATADSLALITSSCLTPTRESVPRLHIFDLHVDPIRFSFTDQVRYRRASALPLLLAEMRCLVGDRPFVIAYPDEGSYKRFRALVPPSIPYVQFYKKRNGDERRLVMVEEQDLPAFEHAVIIDDVVQSGQTVYQCAVALKQAGARRVSAFCTHVVFPQNKHLEFLRGGSKDVLDHFWITDSNPQRSDHLEGKDPFRVLSIAGLCVSQLGVYPYNRVFVSSSSPLKIRAVRDAFSEVFGAAQLTVDPIAGIDSGVSSQPLGEREIRIGLENRHRAAAAAVGSGCHLVSIENGIVEEGGEGEWVDVAWIQWTNDTGQTVFGRSASVPVPKAALEEWPGRADRSQTLGDVMVGMGIARDAADWHLDVKGQSRAWLIKRALVQMLLGEPSLGIKTC